VEPVTASAVTRIERDVHYTVGTALRHDGVDIDEAGGDFRRWLESAVDLQAEARHLASCDDGGTNDWKPPRPHPDLTTPETLALESPQIAALDQFLDDESPGNDPQLAERLGRELTQFVFTRIFRGTAFPIEVSPERTFLGPGPAMAFAAGPYATVPGESLVHVEDYFAGILSDDADRAFDALAAEMIPGPSASLETARRRLRQAAPLSSGASPLAGELDGVTAHMAQGLRILREQGFRPLPHVIRIYQSLFSMSRTVSHIGAGGGCIREGIQAARASANFDRVREAASSFGPETMQLWTTMIVELPRRVDELLSLAAARAEADAIPPRPQRQAAVWPVLAIAGGVLMLWPGDLRVALAGLALGMLGGAMGHAASRR
jgi:hypothetical protein